MTITVKDKTDLVVPTSVRCQAGIKAGDRLEFKVSGGIISIIPKPLADDDEYTPEQRRIIDAQLDEAEKGPFFGPFNGADEMVSHMKSELRKRAESKKSKRSR